MSLSNPFIIVECDDCGVEDDISLTVTARGWDDRDVPDQLKRLGYVRVGEDDAHYCEDCARTRGLKENEND